MSLWNTEDRFGLVTRVLHWVMALGVIGMLGFGTYIANMTVNMSNFHLYAWHKSIGLTLLLLALVRIVWHLGSRVPKSLPAPKWQEALARVVHFGLFLLLLAVPLTGWIASAATGIDVVFWGVTLPSIAPASEAWEDAFFAAHGVLTKLLLAAIVLHIAGAVKRRDGTLRRMVRGQA
ncbi:cytochrome b [Maritimibacter dapengensis]|uniref:Cytochrome b n=1 Tax=Maritimibacter dapengensis TaxID=2836868 RepID=A0ABS6SX10_9RHOB|nr:cytochrome b [Maritimibacter dapengensis]MBV7377496.1 cytochrome b [Maritimibacter dapengensis]